VAGLQARGGRGVSVDWMIGLRCLVLPVTVLLGWLTLVALSRRAR